MPKNNLPIPEQITVSLPFGIGSASWKIDPVERKAAWELYVELATRVAVQSMEADIGLMRESLNSLYTLFASTRDILRAAGPNVGISKQSVGGIAIAVLNQGLRPFLSQWHPALQDWEARRPSNISARAHEKAWSEEPALRQELAALRQDLEAYARALAAIAGVEH